MVAEKASSFTTMDFDSELTQKWTTISLCFLLGVIGVPIWWKTTEIYRADLPFNEISRLHNEQKLYSQVDVEMKSTSLDISSYASGLAFFLDKTDPDAPVNVLYDVTMINRESGNSVPIASNTVPANVIQIVFEEKNVEDFEVSVSQGRIVYCYISATAVNDENKVKEMLTSLTTVIKTVIVNEGILSEMVSNNYGTRTHYKHDKSLKKIVQSNLQFELLFSLLCPEPQTLLPNWNIRQAMQLYMEPMIQKVKPVFGFHVDSQVLYFTKITYKPKVMKDKKGKVAFSYLRHDELSHVINRIEAKIGSQVTSDPTFNFAVYVTEQKYTPMYIMKEDGNVSRTNSFLVPRWGAMVFYNFHDDESRDKASLNMKRVMEPLRSHFRTLLGVQPHHKYSLTPRVTLEPPGIDGLTDWELDYLMRLRTSENLATSVHTLFSLSKLLNQIKNIVINDNIADEVHKAVNSVAKAKELLRNGSLSKALAFSRTALNASETAFFDSTLLELLYFPEDQKFAIYIPFFLPVSLPLFVAIIHVVKRMKANKKVKSE